MSNTLPFWRRPMRPSSSSTSPSASSSVAHVGEDATSKGPALSLPAPQAQQAQSAAKASTGLSTVNAAKSSAVTRMSSTSSSTGKRLPRSTSSSKPSSSFYKSPAGLGNASQREIIAGTRKIAKELDEFEKSGLTNILTCDLVELPMPSGDQSIADLQLSTCRKLRQLLPTHKDLLQIVQCRHWIPLMTEWLNMHDRPAVQIETLLALTQIAEMCAHSYYGQPGTQSSTVAAAAAAAQAAAGAAVKSGVTNLPALPSSTTQPPPSFPGSPFWNSSDSSKGSSGLSTTYPYPPLLSPTSGQIPFPPLSFSQQMSNDALKSFDASLTNTIQQSLKGNHSSTLNNSNVNAFTNDLASSSTALIVATTSPSPTIGPLVATKTSASGPLVPSTSSSIPITNAFLPPPTPVPMFGGGYAFPQNLSSSAQHLLLRHADAIPTLISLLSSPNREVYEQATWILGSIAAGDSPGSTAASGGSNTTSETTREKSVAARDVILAAGVMNQLLRCLEAHPQNLSLQRIASWTLSNLVEGLFQQPSSHKSSSKASDYSSADEIDMVIVLPVLRRLLRMADAEVLSYTCWTLSHLCDGPSSHIAVVVTTRDSKTVRGGLVPRLVELLLHPSWRVTKPALRTIGNIVCAECSDDNNHISSSPSSPTDYTEIILDCGAVPRLKELVTHSNREIQKEACWTLSNIAAGTVDQIQAVIDSGAIPPLVKLVSDKNTDQEVRSEACWVVLNATSCGSDPQIEILVDEGCVSVLGVLLGEASMVMMALEGLERVLQVEESRETARKEQHGKVAVHDNDHGQSHTPSLVSAALIEKALEKHNSSAVTKRANRIWKQHFVSCALCNKSFSKHRTSDARFCEECKCHVCCKCDCKIYHLSYQEELWAVDEEKVDAKKTAKKSKKQKKKAKQKEKKAKQQQEQEKAHVPPIVSSLNTPQSMSKETGTTRSRPSSVTSDSGSEIVPQQVQSIHGGNNSLRVDEKARIGSVVSKFEQTLSKEEDEEEEDVIWGEPQDVSSQQPPIDFVLYLQQTGSIIALAKLMDALYGDGSGFMDKEEDKVDLELISREQQALNQQATT